jgi:Ca2+-binding EF-hand superfamily protein
MKQFDKDNSGRLDKSEMRLLMIHLNGGKEVTDEEVDRVFNQADKSKTGDLKLKEIVEASSIWSAMLKEKAFVATLFDK